MTTTTTATLADVVSARTIGPADDTVWNAAMVRAEAREQEQERD